MRTEHLIDAEVRLIGKGGILSKDRFVNAGDRFGGSETTGDGSGYEVHLFVGGEREKQIAPGDGGVSQHLYGGGISADDVDIKRLRQFFGSEGVEFDDRDIMSFVGYSLGDIRSDLTCSGDDDVHRFLAVLTRSAG